MKRNAWCAVPECTQNFNLEEERHFFRFPKEHDRFDIML